MFPRGIIGKTQVRTSNLIETPTTRTQIVGKMNKFVSRCVAATLRVKQFIDHEYTLDKPMHPQKTRMASGNSISPPLVF